MGRRGPAPKPTRLKVLEGNPGKQKLNRDEPEYQLLDKLPPPPRHLFKAARKEWKKLGVPLMELGVMTQVDLDAFAELCQNYAYLVIISQKIHDQGESAVYDFEVTESGYKMPPVLTSQRNKYYEMWRKSLADFGLTPATRSRIVATGTKGAKSVDPVEAMLSGGF